MYRSTEHNHAACECALSHSIQLEELQREVGQLKQRIKILEDKLNA